MNFLPFFQTQKFTLSGYIADSASEDSAAPSGSGQERSGAGREDGGEPAGVATPSQGAGAAAESRATALLGPAARGKTPTREAATR